MTNLFLDTEFTALTQKAKLISIAIVAETGEEFYAEFTDYKKEELSDFVRQNVIPELFLQSNNLVNESYKKIHFKGNSQEITGMLLLWFSQFGSEKNIIQIWADNAAYDWVLFCELFGGSMQRPKSIHYMCMDLATFFLIQENDADIDRLLYINDPAYENAGKHNALVDAILSLRCYKKLRTRSYE